MEVETDKQQIVEIATSSLGPHEQRMLSEWAKDLDQAGISSLPWRKRVQKIWKISKQSGVSRETFSKMASEIKRVGWDERSPRMRVAMSVFLLAAAAVGGKAGGFAAMGHAIRVSLPFVFSGLSYIFAGLIEEFGPKSSAHSSKTTYTVIEAEKIEQD
jgi:hypothetical protein